MLFSYWSLQSNGQYNVMQATTSLFQHLAQHSEVIRPWEKEPEFFSSSCRYNIPDGCSPAVSKDYIQRVLRNSRYCGYNGQLASFEASTHYSRNGDRMAKELYNLFPWVKIVISLREPISRAASMLVHLLDKNITTSNYGVGGCLAANDKNMGYCLYEHSQIRGDDWGGPTEYAGPLKAWIEAFPPEQVFILQVSWPNWYSHTKIMVLIAVHQIRSLSYIFQFLSAYDTEHCPIYVLIQIHALQYENLTANEETGQKELRRLKSFLGIDPYKPEGKWSSLQLYNSRKEMINPEGWVIERKTYQMLVDIVKLDCEKVANLVDEHHLGDGKAMLETWETIWRENINSCDEDGYCLIQLS